MAKKKVFCINCDFVCEAGHELTQLTEYICTFEGIVEITEKKDSPIYPKNYKHTLLGLKLCKEINSSNNCKHYKDEKYKKRIESAKKLNKFLASI